MEIAVVGATAVVSLENGVVRDARIAITALAPTVRRVAVAEAALIGTDGGPARPLRRAAGPPMTLHADLRRPLVARIPPGDGRGRRPPRRHRGDRAGSR